MFRQLLFLAPAFLLASALPADDRPRISKYQRDAGLQMLEQVRRDIEQLHYNRPLAERKLAESFETARERVTQAGTNAEIFRAIAGLTRSLNDSHTIFVPPRWGFDVDYGFRVLAAGKWCLIHAVRPGSDAERQSLRVGDRLLAIDDAPVSPDTLRAWRYLLTAIEPRQSLGLTVATPGEAPRKVSVATTIKERQRNLDLMRDMAVFTRHNADREQRSRSEFHEFDGVLVWRLKHFQSDEDITEGLRKIRAFDRVVLDLRGNEGGLVGQVLRLTAVLMGRDTRIGVRRTRDKTEPVIAELRREQPWNGRLMVLVDRASSTGPELLAAAVQQHGRGILLGDRTAGMLQEGQGSVHHIGTQRLTIYAIMVAIAEIELEGGRKIEGEGVLPDFLMPLTDSDLRDKRDVVLAMALRQLGVTRRPEELAGISWVFEPKE